MIIHTLFKSTALAVFSLIVLAGCQTTRIETTRSVPRSMPEIDHKSDKNIKGMPGISGMAAETAQKFLVVHDAKAHKVDLPRLGWVSIDTQSQDVRYSEIAFPTTASSPSSDLEGACAVPNRAGEFLVNESGTWQGDYGRLFHIRVTGQSAELISENKLPVQRDNNPTQSDGDQYEGLACMAKADGSVLVILGERGGTARTPTGVLRWGTYDPMDGTVNWDTRETTVSAPNIFNSPKLRSITGLDIDAQGNLYAGASIDSDTDLGPFRSMVYRIGTVSPDQIRPVTLVRDSRMWISDGIKIEAVETVGGMSIGAEDENLGGVWRWLPKEPITR